MLTLNVTSARMAKHKINNIAMAFDLSAAFHCPTFDSLEEDLIGTDVYDTNDETFVHQMIHSTTTEIECGDSCTSLKHHQGVLMGTSRAPKDFNHTTRPLIVAWNHACESLSGAATGQYVCKLTGTTGDLSITKFADELHRRAYGDTPQETYEIPKVLPKC